MKLHLGPWGVAAGALLSVVLVGCDAPKEEPKLETPPAGASPAPGTPKNYPGPIPKEPTKAAEPALEPPKDETKKEEPTPAPKDEIKKEEPPK